MFWKFQTRPTPAESAAEPTVRQPWPAAPASATVPPPSSSDVQTSAEPPPGYQQSVGRTMRFLANALGIPTWVLLRNRNGSLSVVEGIGEYDRLVPATEFPVARLAELPTINLLGASQPATSNPGLNRREGGVDPAQVAPYGLTLIDADGNFFGILCALGEPSQSPGVRQSRPLLDYAAAMLDAAVRSELTLEEAVRRSERAQADALVDPLTGLHNRRAWDQLLVTEDQRCIRHGYDAVVFVIDLDGLKTVNDRFGHEKGDELIRNAATALERSVRRTDVVARVGGDEFSILAVKCDGGAAPRIRDHIESTLVRSNAPATVGYAVRSECGDLLEAWRQADGAMYQRKRANPRRLHETAPDEAVRATAAPPHRAQPERVHDAVSVAPGEASVVSQIIENVVPALLAALRRTEFRRADEPKVAPEPRTAPVAQPSEDLVEIVSRLSRLSDPERRLLGVFVRGKAD